MRLAVCASALSVLVSASAFAQVPPAAPPPAAAPPAAEPPPVVAEVAVPPPAAAAPAAPAPAAPAPKFVFGGLADTYYLFNFIRATNANTLTPPVGRAFDTNSNSVTLALAKLTMNASLDPVSFQLDIGYGSVGTIINNSFGGGTIPPNPSGAFLVEQAYGEIALPGNLTLDFGKFTTTAGAEVIEANKNWLYSRSLLFNAIPLLHTGVRANLKVSDQLTLQGSLVNGWNDDPDVNAWKTIGLSASITASPMVSVIATTYFGKEAPQGAMGSTPGDLRVLGDVVVAVTVNDKFGLNLNIDYIKAFDNVAADYLVGAALMGRYVVADHLYLAARGEFLSVHTDGPPSHTASYEEGTGMAGIPVGKNFELRPEIRFDHSGDQVFAGGMKKNQFTGEVAALTFF